MYAALSNYIIRNGLSYTSDVHEKTDLFSFLFFTCQVNLAKTINPNQKIFTTIKKKNN